MTSLALCLSKDPSALSLTLYTHLLLISLLPCDKLVSSHVPLACKASISFFIASTQLESWDASL